MKFVTGECTQCGFESSRLIERHATPITPAKRLCAYCERERWMELNGEFRPAQGKEHE